MSIMPDPADERGQSPKRDVTDAAWNAVAVASIAYQQEVMALTRILDCARQKGLSVTDLCWASGLDEAFVNRLLGEAAI
jgi:hypothetical protein